MGWLVYIAISTAAGAAERAPVFEEYRPIDAKWAEDPNGAIRWEGDWDRTYEANVERFKQMAKAATDRGRERKLTRVRHVRLLRAMIERFKPGADRRIAAYREIVYNLDQLRLKLRANAYRRKLVEEFPGRMDVAAGALGGILREAESSGQEHWVRYAADRLIALNEAGHLPDGHRGAIEALGCRIRMRLERMWLPEADQDLEALRRHLPPSSARIKGYEAALLDAAGRLDAARAKLAELSDEEGGDSDIRSLRRHVEQADHDTEPVLPRRLELEGRWEAMKAREMKWQLPEADGLLEGLSEYPSLLASGPRRHGSTWRAVVAHVHEQDAAVVAEFRKLQDEKARETAAALAASGDVASVMAAWRRYPFAPSVERAVLAAGERLLRRGQAGLAGRMFDDLRTTAADADVQRRAQVGLWLARAGGPDAREALADELRRPGPDGKLPWPTGPLPGPTILRRLLDSLPAPAPRAEAMPLAKIRQQPLPLPAAPAWAPGQLHGLPGEVLAATWWTHGQTIALDGGRLAFGPNLLARFNDGQPRARWIRTARLAADWIGPRRRDADRSLTVPGPTRPAVAGDRLYCRWGLERSAGRPEAVAAFESATGRMLWSTTVRAGGQKLDPITEPVHADGRLYLLGVRADVEVNTPIHLVCLKASDGGAMWHRLLGHQTLTFRVGSQAGPLSRQVVDLTRYGGSLTVRRGEVYAATAIGFAARCDARDGLIEWTRSYERAPADRKFLGIVRREGPPPAIAGEAVILLPRDCRGALALDRRTGRLLWDNPYLPSDHLVDVRDGVLIASDGRRICAAEAATGRIVWLARLPEELRGRPVRRGESIYVAAPSGLYRLAAGSGAVLERARWQAGPLHDFVLRGGVAAGIGARSGAGALPAARPKPPAPPADEPIRLPMGPYWQLTRPYPRAFLAPADGPFAAHAAICSEGALECVSLAGRPTVRWRRLVRPGFRDLLWSGRLLLAVYPDGVVAHDAEDGRVRWRHGADGAIATFRLAGPHLLLTFAEPGHAVALLDAATGKLRWRRLYGGGLTGRDRPVVAAADTESGRVFLLVRPKSQYTKQPPRVVTCRLDDGEPIATGILPTLVNRKWPAMQLAGGAAWAFGTDGRVHELRSDGEGEAKAIAYDAALPIDPSYSRWHLRRIEPAGRWLCARFGRSGHRYNEARQTYVFRRGDRRYTLTVRGHGEVRGDLYYECSAEVLSVIDLARRRERVRYVLPGVYRNEAEIIGWREVGDRMYTVAFAQAASGGPTLLRVDRFEARGGKHLGSQGLNVRYGSRIGDDRYHNRRPPALRTPPIWQGNTLFVSDAYGLHAFAPAAAPPGQPDALVMQPRVRPVVVDGSLAEWEPEAAVAMADAGEDDAKLWISHDEKHLYLAASRRDADAAERMGTGQYGGGDFLEVGLASLTERFRFLVGQGGEGRAVVEVPPGGRSVEGMTAAVRHDAAAGVLSYELSMPLDKVVYRRDDWRRLTLAATLWDERSPGGSVPVARFGGGLESVLAATGRYRPVRLGPMLHRHAAAGLAVAREAIALPETMDFLREYCHQQTAGQAQREKLCLGLLRAQPDGPGALRAMAMLDRLLRRDATDDPSKRVVRIARAAGVDEAACRQYLGAARTHLSLWVRLWPKVEQPMVMVQLSDGQQTDRAWEHRAFWGNRRWPYGLLNTPSLQPAGPLPAPGAWTELRVPMVRLDMHDRPVHGLSLTLWGNGQIDRVAIVSEAGEEVLIDDELPKGSATCELKWVTDPVKSGAKALHKTGRPYSHNTVTVTLARPFKKHLAGLPPARPIDTTRAIAALRKHLPGLAGSRHAWPMLKALRDLEAGEDHAKRLGLYEWFLRIDPNSRNTIDALVRMQHSQSAVSGAKWPEQMEAVLARCRIPPDIAYEYRSRHAYYGQMFLRRWQLLGPLPLAPADGSRPPAIEADGPIDLKRQYDGVEGKVGWRVPKNSSSAVDLAKMIGLGKGAFAYAVCWVRSERAQRAVVEFGVAETGKVWVNRDLVLTHAERYASARQARAPVELKAGWNEILVRVAGKTRRAKLYFELIAPNGGGLPKGVEITTERPSSPAGGP